MATIEWVKIGGDGRNIYNHQHANVSNIVGIGGKNERNDVMLIQALFKLVGYSDPWAEKSFGLAAKDLPEPTGDFDEKTIRAIWAFQRRLSCRLLNVDGKIHPANYKNRVLGYGMGERSRVMMITLLNVQAVDGGLMLTGGDTLDGIRQLAPSIFYSTESPNL